MFWNAFYTSFLSFLFGQQGMYISHGVHSSKRNHNIYIWVSLQCLFLEEKNAIWTNAYNQILYVSHRKQSLILEFYILILIKISYILFWKVSQICYFVLKAWLISKVIWSLISYSANYVLDTFEESQIFPHVKFRLFSFGKNVIEWSCPLPNITHKCYFVSLLTI